jgi:hypothetical protein
MAWPSTALDIITEIAPGANPSGDPGLWTWVDVSTKVRYASQIGIGQGRADEANRVDAGTASSIFDNRSGDFSTKNPNGQWYGQLRRNTPLRHRVRPHLGDVTDSFTRTVAAGWGTSTSGIAWFIAGVGGTLVSTELPVNGTAGLQMVPVAAGYRLAYMPSVLETDIEDMRVTCTVGVTATGGDLEPCCLFFRARSLLSYYMIRPVIDATTQAITLRCVSPSGVQLASIATGVTHVAGTAFTVAVQALGDQIKAKLWQGATEPTTWQLAVSDDEYIGVGYIGIRSGVASGNTNTKPVTFTYDNFSVVFSYTVFEGFVAKWPPRWDRSRQDITTPIDAVGVLSRLQMRDKRPLKSPLNRGVTTAAPVQWWPLDDGRDTIQALSAVANGTPLDKILGVGPTFDVTDGPLGDSARFPEVVNSETYTGGLTAKLNMADTGGWSIEGWFRAVPIDQTSNVNGVLAKWNVSGSFGQSFFFTTISRFSNITQVRLFAYHEIGGTALWTINLPLLDGSWHQWRVSIHQDTSTAISLDLRVDGVLREFSVGLTPFTVGHISALQVGAYADDYLTAIAPVEGLSSLSCAHYAIYDSYSPASTYTAGTGYNGETAGDRLIRIFAEQGERVEVEAGTTVAMGPQPTDTFLSIVRECETTDGGVLYERRFGLAYQPRSARYNKAVSLSIDFDNTKDIADPPEPIDDVQQLHNYREVKRSTGSRAVAFDQTSIDREGLFEDTTTVNTATDDVLYEIANWLLHLGTNDELRWPRLSLDLRARPNLLVPWLKTQVGSKITAVHPPFPAGPGSVDVFQEGWDLELGPYSCNVTMNCSPSGLYQVGVIEGAGTATTPILRIDTSGSSVSAAVTSTATSMFVTSTGVTWTTTATRPADFPFSAEVGGEQVTVTAITDNLNLNPYFETDVSDWSIGSATLTRSTAQAHEGTASMLITPAGGSATISASPVSNVPAIAGTSYTASAWAYSPLAWGDIQVAFDWFTSTGAYISTSFGGSTTLSAGVWKLLTGAMAAPANSARMVLRVRIAGTPAPANLFYIDQATVTGGGMQMFTVARSVNGVVKAQPVGSPVRVWKAPVIAL